MTRKPDATIAIDDFLVQRWHHCTACGARPKQVHQVLMDFGPVAFCCLQCPRCRVQDPTMRGLHLFLARRYSKEKDV